MADENEKVTICGYVPQRVKERLGELLLDDETMSQAVSKAVRTEIHLRERAMDDSKETAATEGDVSHETDD